MSDDRDIKITVMQAQIEGLREQQKAHKEDITRSLNDLADKVFHSLNGIRDDMKDVYGFINRGRGSIAALLICSSALGGAVMTGVSWVLARFLK